MTSTHGFIARCDVNELTTHHGSNEGSISVLSRQMLTQQGCLNVYNNRLVNLKT